MTCYHPLHAYKARSKTADNKRTITFRPSSSIRCERVDLPCGQCVGCRLERSRQWAVRCMHEASLYEDNSFITLTYNDQNIPKDGSLHLEHFQKFMKRLRKQNEEKKIKFFHCGEYGEQFARPHYHALLFNHAFADQKYFKGSGQNRLFTSDDLSALWPYGHSLVGNVTFESAGYVARYALKKITGERSEEHYQGRKPEYSTMSRRPGIGKGWYEKYKTDVYPSDRVIVRGRSTRPPRFYDNILGSEDRSSYELMKIAREKNGQHYVEDVTSDGRKVIVSDGSGPRLLVKEIVKQASISQLKRPLEEI